MKLSRYLIPSIVVSFIAGIACYIASNNIFLGLGCLGIYILTFVFLFLPILDSYDIKKKKSHEAYRFINSFIITLSATHSYSLSFESAMQGSSKELLTATDALTSMEDLAKAKCLEDYFCSPLYSMFIRVLDLYANQGGDVLRLSQSLLEEVTRVEETNRQKEKAGSKNLLQYLILWVVSTAIVVFLRFGLSSFFNAISHNLTYLICLCVYFAFMLVSFGIYAVIYTGESIKFPFKARQKEIGYEKN